MSLADPACMCPAASSDMPLTTSAPGSRTASGARTVRNGPSSSPALAAPKTAKDTSERGKGRQQRLHHLVPLRQLNEHEHDDCPDRGRGDVGPAGLQDQRNTDGEHGPGEGDQPQRMPDRATRNRRELFAGGVGRELAPEQLVADTADARGLVKAQTGGSRPMRCGTTLGQGDDQTRGTDCCLDVGVAQLNAHLGELLLDLLHRLSGRDHGGAEVSQQGAGLGSVVLVSGTGWGHHARRPFMLAIMSRHLSPRTTRSRRTSTATPSGLGAAARAGRWRPRECVRRLEVRRCVVQVATLTSVSTGSMLDEQDSPEETS